MFDNPLKNFSFQSSHFSNESSGNGTRPQILEGSNPNAVGDVQSQTANQQSSTDQQNSPAPEEKLWGNEVRFEMANDQWNQVRSQIKQRWTQLSDQDLLQTQGNLDKICTLIQQRTGQKRQEIERKLRHFIDREPESEGSATRSLME